MTTETLNEKEIAWANAECDLIAEYVKTDTEVKTLIEDLSAMNPADKKYSDFAHHISEIKQTTELYRTMKESELFLKRVDSSNKVKIGGIFMDTGVTVISRAKSMELFPAIEDLKLEEQVEYCRVRGYLIDGTVECDNTVWGIYANSSNLWHNKVSNVLNNKK